MLLPCAILIGLLQTTIMRIFRKQRRPKKAADKDDASIGSALSSQDQFDIVVFRKPGDLNSADDDKRTRSSSIMSYFTSDYGEESTVSSLTLEDYRSKSGFYGTINDPASSTTSWCCCSDTTLTQPSSVETNTVVQTYEGDIGDFDTAAPGGRVPVSNTQRAILFANWRRSSSQRAADIINQQQHSLHHQSKMSPSLFDALQEEDVYANSNSGFLRARQSRMKSQIIPVAGATGAGAAAMMTTTAGERPVAGERRSRGLFNKRKS